MSLIGALNIGKSALATQQAAIQVTGNNIANAGNADYTRQVTNLSPGADQQLAPGMFVGTGVNLDSVQRQIDEALQNRLRSSMSDSTAADTNQQWLGQIESVFNELGNNDLSTQLSTFFASWSNLANKPQDIGVRQVVLENGQSVAKWFNDLRRQFTGLQKSVDGQLPGMVNDADRLAQQIADLNGKIVVAEGGTGGTANGLRDQRDAVIKQLSQLIDVKTINQQDGQVNVYVGSEPLVVGTMSRGVGLRQDTTNGASTPVVVFKANNSAMNLAGGQLGAMTQVDAKTQAVIDQVDKLASSLIFELNKIHASGQGLEGFGSVTSTNTIADPTLTLNDPKAGLPNVPTNGSFVVHVKDKATGLVTSTLVQVDLDGLNNNDTTLNSLRASLAAVNGVNATVSAGRLTVAASSSAVELSFSQDSSGTLAALGMNSFYTGKDASDIAVNSVIQGNPNLLAAAKNGEKGDNQTARAIAALEDQSMTTLAGSSMKDAYQSMVNGVAVSVATAKNDAQAATAVKDTLESQREALSGVSLDEEAVNLMRQQRAFQGAARLITAVNEMMDTVLNIVK
jgi:flagellar hook-associated protein 1 FlgK